MVTIERTTTTSSEVTTPIDLLTEQTTMPNFVADPFEDGSSSTSKVKNAVEYILNDAYSVQEGLIPKDYRNLELPPIPPNPEIGRTF